MADCDTCAHPQSLHSKVEPYRCSAMSLLTVSGDCECPKFKPAPPVNPPKGRALKVVVNSFGEWLIEKDGGPTPSTVFTRPR